MRCHKEIREDNQLTGIQSEWVRKTQGREVECF